jgi:hypothetical protein
MKRKKFEFENQPLYRANARMARRLRWQNYRFEMLWVVRGFFYQNRFALRKFGSFLLFALRLSKMWSPYPQPLRTIPERILPVPVLAFTRRVFYGSHIPNWWGLCHGGRVGRRGPTSPQIKAIDYTVQNDLQLAIEKAEADPEIARMLGE